MRAQLRIAKTLAAALLAVVAQSAAAGADSGFSLNLDRLDIGIYTVDIDTDSAKFNEYRDWTSGFTIPEARDHGWGQGDRSLSRLPVELGRPARRPATTSSTASAGRWGVEVDYNKIPHRFGNNGRSVQTETSPGVWQISDTTQAAFQAAIEIQRGDQRRQQRQLRLSQRPRPALPRGRRADRSRAAARPDPRDRRHRQAWAGSPGPRTTSTRTATATGRTARHSASTT